MSNFITILIATDNRIATKTFTYQTDGRIKEDAYRCGYNFRHLEIEVNDIDDLYKLLQALEERQDAFIVRGEVLPKFRGSEEITRTLWTIPEDRQIAMIGPIAGGCQWMICDFDKIDLPDGMTPAQGVEMLIKTLPPEFHDVTCAYQLSSSAGVAGPGYRLDKKRDANGDETIVEVDCVFPGWSKINAHVFFWLTKKHSHLAQWAKNLNATRGRRVIDPSFLETVQPNYCACPRFVNMVNPVPIDERSGLIRKTQDAADLVWIDAPIRTVKIGKIDHKVGGHVVADGATYIATHNLQDRLDQIGQGGEFRDPLKRAIAYYFWVKGRVANEQEIKQIIRSAPIDWAGRNYLGGHLDKLVEWFASRNPGHEPMRPKTDDLLAARLIEWRKVGPEMPDAEAEDDDDWRFDLENSELQYNFAAGECGEGKTEWMIDQLAGVIPEAEQEIETKEPIAEAPLWTVGPITVESITMDPEAPARPANHRPRLVCLPRIDMIREVRARLVANYPDIEQTHHVHTIFSDKEADVRDKEDAPDDQFAPCGTTVTYQVSKFRERVSNSNKIILFITHAALLMSDWRSWTSYEIFVDEIPEPYQTQARDFTNTPDFVRQFVEPIDELAETNYHRLGLTDDGYHKVGINGSFDDNEQSIRSLLDAIRLPNQSVYAQKKSWDQMASQEVALMRLLRPGFMRYFRRVTILGDEFLRSTLAMAFTNKSGVEWVPHPDWHPTRTRSTPLKDRVRLFYFASHEELRGSLNGYEDRQLIPKLIKWLQANDPGQVLITTNNRFRHLFEKPDLETTDTATPAGIQRTAAKLIKLLWVPPKLAGTDIYKTMTSVAFFAAMRPSNDEVAFVGKSLRISENDIIRWREFNTLYQFVMRICLRLFDSDSIANVYVYDESQADYLRERFGGCLEFIHVRGAIPAAKRNKGGRPRTNADAAMSAADRKRRQRGNGKKAA